MFGTRHSKISHRTLPYYNPISEEKLDEAINKLSLKANQRVIDFGGGEGEFVIRLIKRFKVKGLVIESPEGIGDKALTRSKGRIPAHRLQVDLGGSGSFLTRYKGKRFDLAACINSISLGTDYRDMLYFLGQVAKPDGDIVIGTRYWKKKPPRNFKMGLPLSDSLTVNVPLSHVGSFEELYGAIKKHGMTPIWASVINEDESDQYAWTRVYEIEKWARENPKDPDRKNFLKECRGELDFYIKHRIKEIYGFALFVIRNGAD